MELHYHRAGDPAQPTLIILHGLLGTWENWRAQIKLFAERFDVIAVDLRNHGASPHSDEIDYTLMADDLIALMDRLDIPDATLLGHSMGGKVVMQLALAHPQRVERLIVVDIAPVTYPRHHNRVFEGLFSVNLDQIGSRRDAETQLAMHVEEASVRAFLLKNLYRTEQGLFDWRMNLTALHDQYDQIAAAPQASQVSERQYTGPVLFIKGGDSDYLLPEHQGTIQRLFPNAQFKIIEGCGHWPHAEKPVIFNRLVERFLA